MGMAKRYKRNIPQGSKAFSFLSTNLAWMRLILNNPKANGIAPSVTISIMVKNTNSELFESVNTPVGKMLVSNKMTNNKTVAIDIQKYAIIFF